MRLAITHTPPALPAGEPLTLARVDVALVPYPLRQNVLRTALGLATGCSCRRCVTALSSGDETRRFSCPSAAPDATPCHGSCLAAADGSALLPCDACGCTPSAAAVSVAFAAEAQLEKDLAALEAAATASPPPAAAATLAALAALPPAPHPHHHLTAARANIAMAASDEAGDVLGAADAMEARLACRRAILGGLPSRADAFLAQNLARMHLRAAAAAAPDEESLRSLQARAQVTGRYADDALPGCATGNVLLRRPHCASV